MAAVIVFLSLSPRPPQLEFEHSDKFGHLLAYGVLMLWFCLLYRSPRLQLAYGCAWIAMGVALEFAQGVTGYRSFEIADMMANSLGVLVGWGISATLRK